MDREIGKDLITACILPRMRRTTTTHTHGRSIAHRTPFYYGWVILAIASLSVFASGPGQTFTVSVFVDPMIAELGWSRSLISGLYALGSVTAAVVVIAVGRLLDRFGARVMLVAVGIVFGLAVIWMSRVGSAFDMYLGFTAIRTLGQGSLTLIPTTLVAIWFVRARGRATALVAIGGAAGAAIFPLLNHGLIVQFGWRGAWVALAFVIWGFVVIPALLLVRRSPESVGLRPDGERAETPSGDVRGAHADGDFTLRQASRTRAFWLLLLAGSSQSLISTALTFHNTSFLGGKGVEPGFAAATLTVMAVVMIAGGFAAGFLNDRLPNRFVLAGGQLLLLTAMLFTFVISAGWLALVYGAIMGVSAGVLMNTVTVIWANYYGRRHLGSVRGVAMTGMMTFAAVGPLPFSLLHDLSGSYDLAVLVFLALPVICVAAAFLAVEPDKPRPA